MLRPMSAHDRWFPFIKPKPGASKRLFCFPPAGGGATLFHSWRELLPPEIDLYAIQLPGRGTRLAEKPIARMEELIRAVVPAVLPYLDRPFALFGHSMGGLIAFEVARQLRRENSRQPLHLFVGATRAPHIRDNDAHHLLPDDQLIVELRKMGGFPREVLNNRELMEMFLPTIRADAAVTETYTYIHEAPISCAITAYAGRDDQKVSSEDVATWRDYTGGRFELVLCPGGHDFPTTATDQVVGGIVRALKAL